MIQSRTRQSDGATAVVFRSGKKWRTVIGRAEGSRVRITAWREFDAIESRRIDHFFDEHEVDHVIGVLPASSVICRVCTLPDGEPHQVEQALNLQAEAQLAELTPSHRQAVGALQTAPDESRRVGLLLAWPETAPFEIPATTRPTTYTADIAAIAAIINGFRPSEPVLWLDQAAGSIAMALTQTEGMAFRAAHEPADSPSQWHESVAHVVSETAINAGYSASFTETLTASVQQRLVGDAQPDAMLLAPTELLNETKSRVTGAPSETQWWSDYGIGVGTLFAASDELAALTQMLASRPEEKLPLFQRLTTALSEPKRAVAVLVICALVIGLWPLASAGLRNLATWARLQDVEEEQYKEVKLQAEVQLHMYEALQKEAWPMSKLLADIACCTPNTITVDQIRLSPGSRQFRLIGLARADTNTGDSVTQVIALMKQQLEETRIFTEVFYSSDPTEMPGTYQFTIEGEIPSPYRAPNYPIEQDYDKWPLVDRLYGDGGPPTDSEDKIANATGTNDDTSPNASESTEVIANDPPINADPQAGHTAVAAATDESEDPEEVVVRRSGMGSGRPGRSDSFSGVAGDRSENRGGGILVTPPSADIPEPVTQAELDVMSEAEVRALLAKVADARRLGRLNPEQDQELREQFRMILVKLRTF